MSSYLCGIIFDSARGAGEIWQRIEIINLLANLLLVIEMTRLKRRKYEYCIWILFIFAVSSAHGQGGPKINLPETVWDIGTIKIGDEAVHSFKIMNIGSDDLEITQVRSSCSCLKAEITSTRIPPNGFAEIKAAFKEDSRMGKVIKTIYIDSNDPGEPRSILRVKATTIEGTSAVSQKDQTSTEQTPTLKIKTPQDVSACIALFFSEDCDDCRFVREELLPKLSERFGDALKVKSYSIDDAENYDLLVALEKQFGKMGNDIPVVFIGEDVLGGEEVAGKLEGLVEKYLSQGGCEFPATAKTGEAVAVSNEIMYLAYFERPGCKACDRANYILKSAERAYPNLKIKRFNSEDKGDVELFEALCKMYGVPEKQRLVAPSVFLGERYLIKEDITDEKLRELIKQYEKEGTKCPWEDAAKMRADARVGIIERFRSLGPFAVIMAGIIDGFNPCAFATIILFMSYLALIGRKGRDLIYVGVTFTLAVFLTYFLVGLGVFRFIQALTIFSLFSRILYILIAVLAFALGVLSFYDFIQARRGKVRNMFLQLPTPIKDRIHKTIRGKARTERFVIAAFITGVIVSLLELACTGQVYLPTLCFVVGVPELRNNAILYLLLYNLMFILPLTIVFIVTYFGTTFTSLARVMQRRVALVKLLTSILFFGLCGFLVSTLV